MALRGPFPINLVFSLFSLPFWAIGLSMLATVLFGLFGRVRLTLTPQTIRQDLELFGFKRSVPPPSQRQDITKLEVTQPYSKTDSDGDRIEVQSQLMIWAGTRQYGCIKGTVLTRPEIHWLA